MRVRLAWVVGMGVLAASCGGAAANGKVSGKVVFADGSPASGISLALTGQAALAATTGASGSFAFTKVPEGDYLLTANVPSTLERQAQVVVVVGKSPVTVPTLTFKAVGTVSGTVVDASGNPAQGAEVRLLGTDRSASTDADGAFTMDRVPTGARSLMASLGAGADQVTGSAQVTVKRGATASATLTLAAPPSPPAPGTITGTVTYPRFADASTITVAAAGSTASTHPNPDGTFSLSVPPGTWEVDATAPEYPEQTLGRAQVAPGMTVALPAKLLSMYRPLPTFGVDGGNWTVLPLPPTTGYLPGGNRALAVHSGPSGARVFAIDLDTLALHPIAINTGDAVLGPKGQQVAVRTQSELYVMSLAGGTTVTTSTAGLGGGPITFALDGKSVLLPVGGQGLLRVDLTTGKSTLLGGAGLARVGPDHFLYHTTGTGSGETWNLVDGDGVTPKVFDAVSAIKAYPLPNLTGASAAVLARKACANADCPLLALAPGATASVPVTLPDGSPYLDPGIGAGAAHGPWILLPDNTSGSAGPYLLDTRTGKTVQVPIAADDFQVSPDGSELAFISAGGDAMYVGKNSAPFAGTAVQGTGLHGTFVAGDTFVAFDESTPARRLVFQGGAAPTVDTDYKPGTGQTRGALAYWVRPSTGNFAARIGDTAAVDLPIPASAPLQVIGSLPAITAAPPPPVGVLVDVYGSPITFVVDGTSGTVTTYPDMGGVIAFPGGFMASDAQSQALDVPADGGAPVPIDEAGAPPFPNGGPYVAPGRTAVIDPPFSPTGPSTIAVFPGLLPGPT